MNKDVKRIIEENPIAFATVNLDGSPHVIAVAYVKVKDDKIIITNNYMTTAVANFKKNKMISLAVWNKKWDGYRIEGEANYFEEGEWFDFVKSIKENEDEPCNGAVVIDIKEIKKLG